MAPGLSYGDTKRFEATKGDERKVFILKKSAGATSDGYKLYGYNLDANERNLLEDFGIDKQFTSEIVEAREAFRRIKFYLGDEWTVSEAEL